MATAFDTSNTQITSGKMSDNVLLVLGKNLTTSVVGLYTVAIGTLDNLSDITKAYLNTSTATNYVRDSKGAIIGDLPGDEEDPAGEVTLTWKKDMNGTIDGQFYGHSRNLIEAMVKGQTFKHGADTIVVVSTLGSRKSGKRATKCEVNKEYKKIFQKEIMNLLVGGVDETTGKPNFQTNSFISKAILEATCVAFENYTFDGTKSTSLLFPALYTANTTFAQADDGDTLSGTFMRKTDVWEGENSLLQGARVEFAVADTDKSYLEVDYIVVNASAPSDFGVNGDVICLVNPSTLAFTIQTSNGSAWTVNATGTFEAYAKITANKTSTGTIASATAGRAMVVTNTVNGTNGGTVVNMYDGALTTKSPLLKMYALNRTSEDFEALVNTAVC